MRSHRFSVTSLFIAALCILGLSQLLISAQDPTKVASTMYKVIQENDQVRILDANLAPGAKTAMHSHPDLAAVVLETGVIKWTRPDGKFEQSPPDFKRGGIQYMAADTHISENIGKTAARVVIVEFKKPAPAAGRGRNVSLPAPCKQVNDNPHARIFECTLAAGAKIAEHTHSDRVEVALTDGTLEITDKDGKKQTASRKKDEAWFASAVTHSAVNPGKTAFHGFVIELK
jgi:quercetin dioxygenase-like cupin family protein